MEQKTLCYFSYFYQFADFKTFFALKIGPLLSKIWPLLCNKFKNNKILCKQALEFPFYFIYLISTNQLGELMTHYFHAGTDVMAKLGCGSVSHVKQCCLLCHWVKTIHGFSTWGTQILNAMECEAGRGVFFTIS